MSSSAVRSWRTAFLTLRDENLASPPRATVVHLLDQLILSQSDSLITAAPQLPPHELTSDFMLLLELARNLSPSQRGIEDGTQTFIKLSQLIHGISRSSFLEMNSTLWTLVLDSFKRIVQIFLGKAKTEGAFIGDVTVIKPTKQCLESLRLLFSLYQAAASLSENGQLLNFVFEVVDYFQRDSKHSTYFSDNCSVSGGVCEVLTIAFSMIGEIYSRVGASLTVEIWKSVVEALRKVMDILASKSLLLEDNIVAMFYIELLHCLHLFLAEPRGYLTDPVAGFVAALRIFFRYGLVNKPSVMNQATNHMKGVGSTSQNMPFEVLDECLRAISGFKGTEDLSNDKSLDSPFTSDFVKTKAISSAPSYSLESPVSTNGDSKACLLASERWLEATIKHMPLLVNHSSAMVRAASVTCFAGMTSSVFFSLPEDKQEFIISSSINAALNDEVPSVRSAACRAIGVIAYFPQIYHSSTEVLEKFIHAAERNDRDSLVSVRITASWAIANICDSLGHCLDALHAGRGSIDSMKCSGFTSLLVESALRLARDNDKVDRQQSATF